MNKALFFIAATVFMVSLGSAVNNNTTSFNESVDVSPQSFNGSISVGHGTSPITGFQVTRNASKTVNGNEVVLGPAEFQAELNGNVSDIGKVYNPVIGEQESVNLTVYGDEVGSSQPYGWYNGTLSLEKKDNASVNTSASLNILVVDGIKPSIQNVRLVDMMATNTQEIVVDTVDNIEVTKVTGEVIFEKVVNESTGERENETVQTLNFTRNNDGSFTAEFNKSSEIGEYYLKLEAVDGSGNQVQYLEGFQVNGLESINVLRKDFDFKDMRPRTDANPERQVKKEVFTKSEERSLVVELSSFTHRKVNSSMTVGLLHEGSENLETLYVDGENQGPVNVSKTGSYYLVVYSDSKGDTYNGEVKLEPVPQHVEIDNRIKFRGTVVDPQYPEIPEDKELGSFKGSMEFILNENDVPKGIRFTGEQREITSCIGADSWSNCIPGFSLGEIDEVKQENEMLESENTSMFWQRNFAVAGLLVFAVVFVLKTRRGGDVVAFHKIPKSMIGNYGQNRRQDEEV